MFAPTKPIHCIAKIISMNHLLVVLFARGTVVIFMHGLPLIDGVTFIMVEMHSEVTSEKVMFLYVPFLRCLSLSHSNLWFGFMVFLCNLRDKFWQDYQTKYKGVEKNCNS